MNQSTPAPDADPTVRHALSEDEIRTLGTTTSLATAAGLFGLSRATAYRLASKGTFPVPVIRAGTQYRVPVAAILSLLFPPHAEPPLPRQSGPRDPGDAPRPEPS